MPAYRVFAVLLGRFHRLDARHDAIFQATSDRLRDILTEVANPPGRRSPQAIDLVWANADEAAQRRPNERAVYFVQSYREGMIHPYAARMRRQAPEQQRTYFNDLETTYLGAGPPSGLTLEDRVEGPVRMLSEVHIDRLMMHYPDVNNTGVRPEQQRQHLASAGRGMGGMAFHELMHAVVDLHQGRSFDLHDLPDIAQVDGFAATPGRDNLALFRRHMLRPTPAQIMPTGTRPRIVPRRPAATEQAPARGLDFSDL